MSAYNKLFYQEHIEFLKKNAKGLSNKEITTVFNNYFKTNYTINQIKAIKQRNHISSGLTGHFPKGNIPYTAGKKWSEFMSKKGQENSLKTTYKKGNKSANCDPIGTEKWKSDHKDRNDKGFLYVKVADGKKQHNWKQKHRLLWEEAYGLIPKNHKVIFLNGNREDIRLENLTIVSNSQMLIMNRNNLISKDPAATIVGSTTAKILDRINKVKK